MIAMNSKLIALLFCASLIPAIQARATILPESCGEDPIKFSVNVNASTGLPRPPAEGKAQIVFIETINAPGFHLTTPTTRFGVDGAWVGANKGDSHFTIDVAPGVRNVCVNWQTDSDLDSEAKRVGMDTFTAEAGKIYYYEIKILMGVQGASKLDLFFNLSQLGGVEGRYRAKASGVSTSKAKKED
jgi:hypothetical protein